MPDELRPQEKGPAVNYTKRTIAATEGQVITGFTAMLEVCGKAFVHLYNKSDSYHLDFQWFFPNL